MICYLFPEPTYFFFSSDVPRLLYYSHIPTTIIALLVGFFVFWYGRQFLLNRLLFGISILFSLWTLSTLIQWTNIHSNFIMFSWSLLNIILGLIAILCIYFVYVFLTKKDVPIRIKVIFSILLSPIIILASTSLNISGFDITSCDAFRFEWLPLKIYSNLIGVIAIIWILFLLIRHYRLATVGLKKQIILIGIGVELFLFLFFVCIFTANYLTQLGIFSDSSFEMYGLLGVVILMIYISVLIVRFKAFNVKLIGAQALVWGLIIVIGSEFFFVDNLTSQLLVGVTLIISTITGFILVRSVKAEVIHAEKIEKINVQLKRLNDDKSEFVSFASHQIRTPLTSIKGYSAEILEGDYGEINPQLKDAIQKILVRGTDAVTLISQYLDKSKMELGQLKYDFTDFDIVELAKSVTKGFEPNAEQSKLTLKFSTTETSPCLVNADKGKVKEVIGNLIDNAIKYTPSGSIEVSVFKKDDKVLVKFSDTGVGMSKEVIADLYKKFGRAKDAAKTNILGTGLGLFLAKTFMEAMKGRSWAESEGDGKGSQFYIELPVKLN